MEENTAKGFNAKHITFSLEGLIAIEQGITTLTRLLKMTYGPMGSNVVLARQFDSPIILNDAQTIIKDFHLDDHYEQMGVQFLQEALLRVKKTVGDGSTTTAILLEEMLAEGKKYIASGHNPMLIRKGMERATKVVVDRLKANASEFRIHPDVKHLARMSSSNEEIASLMEEAVDAVGREGIILVGESKKTKSEVVIHDGIFLERGLISNLMAKDTFKIETHLENPYIFITDKKLSSHVDVVGILEQMHQLNGSLLLIAESIEGTALSTLTTNQLKGTVNVVAIQAPEYGDYRKAILEDLAVLTGGVVFDQELTRKIPLDYYGRAQRVVVTKKSTLIFGGERKEQQIQLRMNEIKQEIGSHISKYDVEKLEKRLGNLIGKTASINIGAVTDGEIGDLLQKTENAIHAVKAGVKNGVVTGGGSAYIRAMTEAAAELQTDGDEMCGVRIILNALLKPARQLLENANVSESLIQEIIERYGMTDNAEGYDIEENRWVNMMDSGLIDSYQLVKFSLEVASSLASSLLTSHATVTDAIAYPH